MQLPFSITVGVTGRRELPEKQLERIESQVSDILDTIWTTSKDIVHKNPDIFSIKNMDLSVCSCLSEGADRFVVNQGLKLGYFIDAAIPFPEDSLVHARDLEGEEQDNSRAELKSFITQSRILPISDYAKDNEATALENTPEGRRVRRKAYLDAGLAMLEQSDILLALWDGEKSENVGGTYDIIKRAISQNIIVLWVHTEKDIPVCEYAYIDGEFKSKKIQDFSVQIQEFFGAPWHFGFSNCIKDMHATERKEPFWASFYDKLYDIIAPKAKKSPIKTQSQKKQSSTDSTIPLELPPSPLKDIRIFSTLAGYYAKLYRSFFLLNCLLGALAVTVAIFAIGLPMSLSGIKIALGFLELGLLSLLWRLHVISQPQKEDWQHKSINYRFLAEVVRNSNFLYKQGISLPVRTALPYYDIKVPLWVTWFTRILLLSHKNLKLAGHVGKVQKEHLLEWIMGQITYHQDKAKRCHHAEHALHSLVEKMFLITFMCIIIHLLGKIFTLSPIFLGVLFTLALACVMRPITMLRTFFLIIVFAICAFMPFGGLIHIFGMLSILFPLWAMTLHALGQYGEFKRMENRSLAMMTQLQKHKNDLEKAETSEEIIQVAEQAAETILDEVNEWNIQSKMTNVVKG